MSATQLRTPRKLLTVEPESVWRTGTVLLAGVLLSVPSMLGLYILKALDAAVEYELSVWIWAPSLLGLMIVYPIVSVAVLFRRIPHPLLGLLYAGAFGLGCHTAVCVAQAVEYGIWKGFADERTMLNWLVTQPGYLAVTLTVSVTILMPTWLACRLVRGPVLIETGGLCDYCGYNLTGNVSGVCSECGQGIA